MRNRPIGLLVSIVAAVVALNLYFASSSWEAPAQQSRRGFTAHRYTVSDGKDYGYVLFEPHERHPDEKLPLLLFLNGVGENGIDGVFQISNNFGIAIWETKRNFPMMCLAPQCRENWGPHSPDTQRALALLDWIIDEFNVDTDRIYLTGVSSGGQGTWDVAAAYPDKFAAIAPIAATCSMDQETVVDAFVRRRLPIWGFYNDGDEAELVEGNRRLRERLLAAGLSPLITEYHQRGHNAWSASYRTAALYEWLGRQSRSNTERLYSGSGFRWLLRDATGLDDWEQRGGGNWILTDGQLRCEIDELTAGGGSLVLKTELEDEFEIHFDFRASGGADILLSLDAIDAPGDDLLLAIDQPERGTGGVVHVPSGQLIGSTFPLGQRAFTVDRWNDVRLSLRKQRLQISVNGVPYYDAQDPRFAGRRRIGLQARPDDANASAWRYVRLWTRNSSAKRDASAATDGVDR